MTLFRSMRVVLATVGSRGDVQPMLALAETLRARGHVPVIAAPPDFEQWSASLGFAFAPLGCDMQAYLAANPQILSGNPFTTAGSIKSFFATQIGLQNRQLLEACRGADALLWAGLAFVALSVAERLEIPAMGVVYSTSMIPSAMHPPPTIPWQFLPRWVNWLLWRLHRVSGHLIVGVPLNKARAEMGLPSVSVHAHLVEQGQYAVAVDEGLFPSDPKWGERFSRANYIFFDDPATLDPELVAWLDDGEPPVFVGFGSMSGGGTNRIGRMVVEAVSATGRRCIVGAGWAGLDAGVLPPGWRVVGQTPHAQLFPRMGVVVHHGGSGTMASALRAGVPQVVLPLILDQYLHAHRLHLAGMAPRPIPMERITATELTQAIQAALALPAQPREAVAARMRASDARGAIVSRLELLAKKTKPATFWIAGFD